MSWYWHSVFSSSSWIRGVPRPPCKKWLGDWRDSMEPQGIHERRQSPRVCAVQSSERLAARRSVGLSRCASILPTGTERWGWHCGVCFCGLPFTPLLLGRSQCWSNPSDSHPKSSHRDCPGLSAYASESSWTWTITVGQEWRTLPQPAVLHMRMKVPCAPKSGWVLSSRHQASRTIGERVQWAGRPAREDLWCLPRDGETDIVEPIFDEKENQLEPRPSGHRQTQHGGKTSPGQCCRGGRPWSSVLPPAALSSLCPSTAVDSISPVNWLRIILRVACVEKWVRTAPVMAERDQCRSGWPPGQG